MDDIEFEGRVIEATGVGPDEARRAIRATLATLGERISRGEARDLGSELPPRAGAWLHADGDPQRFGADEFVRRVAARMGTDPGTAARLARAVLGVVGRAVDRRELLDLRSELPHDIESDLLPEGRLDEVRVRPADDLLGRVAARAGLDPERARRATEAVLETLAERISGGEVDDLERRLPPELRGALERGREGRDGAARKMSLDDFLRRVGEREGATLPEARAHARAVLQAVREAVGDSEFADLRAELPSNFVRLFA